MDNRKRSQFSKLSLLIFSLLITCATLTGQTKKDTTVLSYRRDLPHRVKVVEYGENEKPIKVVFAKQMDATLTREDRFMMGIKEKDVAGLLLADSIQFYDRRGRLMESRIFGAEKAYINHFHPKNSTARPWKEYRSSDDVREFVFPRGGLILDRKIVYEGKIGQVMHKDVAIRSLFEGKTELRVSSDDPKMSCPALFTVQDGVKHLPTSYPVSSDIKKVKLYLDNFLGDTASFMMVIMGFDLQAGDFSTQLEDAPLIELVDRKKVILKSDGSEKLLRLVRDDVVVEYFKFSKIRNEINLKGYKRGNYILEAIDLASNEKKFAKISIP